MTDDATDGGQLPPAPFKLLAQYLKDLSFENPGAPHVLTTKGDVPRGQLKLDVQARTVAPMQYEVTGAPDDHVAPLLMTEAPRILFPFARQVLAKSTHDGGYPPVMLNHIDF